MHGFGGLSRHPMLHLVIRDGPLQVVWSHAIFGRHDLHHAAAWSVA